MSTEATTKLDRARIAELTEREQRLLNERTGASRALYERARRALAGGVASAYQARDPWPIYLERGSGSRVWDVDGNEMIDFHNGFGSMVQGHAHPAIVARGPRASRARHALRRADRGRRRTSPRSWSKRFGLPRWRFVNSGSEATMDAIRIARAPDRPRDDRQDLRLLPRAPRLRDGLDRRPVRGDRRPRGLRVAALRRGHPAVGRRPDRAGAVQRRRRDGAADRAAVRRGPPARLRDHGAGDDEPRGRAPRARLPRGGARADAAPRRGADLRRGQDGAVRSRRAARPSGSASRPT